MLQNKWCLFEFHISGFLLSPHLSSLLIISHRKDAEYAKFLKGKKLLPDFCLLLFILGIVFLSNV